MKSSIVNIDNKFFFILNKEDGSLKKIEIEKDRGIIIQLNEAIDDNIKE